MCILKAKRTFAWVVLLTGVCSVLALPSVGQGDELQEYLYGAPTSFAPPLEAAPLEAPSEIPSHETHDSPSDLPAATLQGATAGVGGPSGFGYDPTAPIRSDDYLGCSFLHDGIWPACGLPAQWGGVEYLAWWRKGRRLPALVTDGVMAPGVNVLFGNGYFESDVESGARVTLGYWIDNDTRIGVGGRLWGLGNSEINYSQSSNGNTTLARPFTNTSNDPATADAFLVATNGQAGQIDIGVDSVIYGGDIFLRKLITATLSARLDLLFGYQFSRIDEGINISTQNAITGGGTFTAFDDFQTENEFHGGLLGLWAQHERGFLTVDFIGKVALGNMRQVARISGGSNGNSPNAGLLAQATNIGVFTNDDFIAVPEINLNISCHITQHLDVTLGYSMLYWSRVVQPGDIIDLNVDPTAGAGATTPAFAFDYTDFWVQGLSVGVNWVF